MNAFTLIIVGGMALLMIALVLIGLFYPGSGAEVLDWKPTRSMETEVQLEVDDVAQMVAAQNLRRRRRGLPDRTIAEVEWQVAEDMREQNRLRGEIRRRSGDAELVAELNAVNARRRQRGEPDLTLAQLRVDLGLGD